MSADASVLSLKPLEKSLTESALWSQQDIWESTFELKNPEAFILVKLDMEKGLLAFSSKPHLSGEEQKCVAELFKAIENEFNQFKKELVEQGIAVAAMSVSRDKNGLTLRVSSPKHFDAFVQRLMDKNLLTIQPVIHQKKIAQDAKLNIEAKTDLNYKSTAPTPCKELLLFYQKSQGVSLAQSDFRKTFAMAKPGDIIYCDPPYAPISQGNVFTTYTGVAFKAKDQIALAECATDAAKRDITVVISNHDTDFTRNLYHRSKITSFPVRRSISCKGDARASVQELLAVFGAPVVTSEMVIS